MFSGFLSQKAAEDPSVVFCSALSVPGLVACSADYPSHHSSQPVRRDNKARNSQAVARSPDLGRVSSKLESQQRRVRVGPSLDQSINQVFILLQRYPSSGCDMRPAGVVGSICVTAITGNYHHMLGYLLSLSIHPNYAVEVLTGLGVGRPLWPTIFAGQNQI